MQAAITGAMRHLCEGFSVSVWPKSRRRGCLRLKEGVSEGMIVAAVVGKRAWMESRCREVQTGMEKGQSRRRCRSDSGTCICSF